MRINAGILTALFLISCFHSARAEQELMISTDGLTSLQQRLISGFDKHPFLGFGARKAPNPEQMPNREELFLRKSRDRDFNRDIVLYAVNYPPIKSQVYRFRGKPCDWICSDFWIFIEDRGANRAAISVMALSPRVARGKSFNIHTFTFTPQWEAVPENPFDTLPVLNHIADLLGQPRIETKDNPAWIDIESPSRAKSP